MSLVTAFTRLTMTSSGLQRGSPQLLMVQRRKGTLVFLNTVTALKNCKIMTRDYRNYRNFDSHHPEGHKRGVARTLMHRVKSILSDSIDLEREKEYIKQVLRMNQYLDWIPNKTGRSDRGGG